MVVVLVVVLVVVVVVLVWAIVDAILHCLFDLMHVIAILVFRAVIGFLGDAIDWRIIQQ